MLKIQQSFSVNKSAVRTQQFKTLVSFHTLEMYSINNSKRICLQTVTFEFVKDESVRSNGQANVTLTVFLLQDSFHKDIRNKSPEREKKNIKNCDCSTFISFVIHRFPFNPIAANPICQKRKAEEDKKHNFSSAS